MVTHLYLNYNNSRIVENYSNILADFLIHNCVDFNNLDFDNYGYNGIFVYGGRNINDIRNSFYVDLDDIFKKIHTLELNLPVRPDLIGNTYEIQFIKTIKELNSNNKDCIMFISEQLKYEVNYDLVSTKYTNYIIIYFNLSDKVDDLIERLMQKTNSNLIIPDEETFNSLIVSKCISIQLKEKMVTEDYSFIYRKLEKNFKLDKLIEPFEKYIINTYKKNKEAWYGDLSVNFSQDIFISTILLEANKNLNKSDCYNLIAKSAYNMLWNFIDNTLNKVL